MNTYSIEFTHLTDIEHWLCVITRSDSRGVESEAGRGYSRDRSQALRFARADKRASRLIAAGKGA